MDSMSRLMCRSGLLFDTEDGIRVLTVQSHSRSSTFAQMNMISYCLLILTWIQLLFLRYMAPHKLENHPP